jgi:hypothetical protein
MTVASCGGGGGGRSTPPPPGSTVIISGTITFDRVAFKPVLGTGLNPAGATRVPARQVVVEAISAAGGNTILASTTTDTAGAYSLTVPANTNLFIRAKAQMVKSDTAPTWSFSVRNNTNDDALYALDGSAASSGTSNSIRDLIAASGWNGSTYLRNQRAAAPFAILDTVYRAKELVIGASASAQFPPLTLFWSEDNRPTTSVEPPPDPPEPPPPPPPFCPDDGNIGTTFYTNDLNYIDNCSPRAAVPPGIYVLGSFASGGGDTDEFDAHVIAHEFGHYIEDRFARSDSFGGDHNTASQLDPRVAFGEGWGNAYAAMALGDPIYRDSQGGISSDFGFNLETDDSRDGWFGELSVGELLWDIFDGTGEAGDGVSLGFTPIFAVMTGAQINTDALTSIYSFAAALRSANSPSAAAIDTLLNNESISGNGEFGAGESNDGGGNTDLPVYVPVVALNTPVSVCTRGTAAGSEFRNRLGNRRFLRFDNTVSRPITIQVSGVVQGPGTSAAFDPDIFLYRRGVEIDRAVSTPLPSTPPGTPGSETMPQQQLDGETTYVIEVLDFDLPFSSTPARCMNVTISG